MTKFNIQTEDLKYIMAALKPAIAKTDSIPEHQCIKFECKEGILSAFSTDGYRIHSVSVHIDITDGKDCFSFLLNPFTIPSVKTSFVPCELTEKEIMFNFGEMKIAFKVNNNVSSHFDVNSVIPEDPAVFRIAFNPKYLADAAKSFKCDGRTPVILEFRTPLQPALLYNQNDKTDFRLIWPVRMRNREGWGTAFPGRNENA